MNAWSIWRMIPAGIEFGLKPSSGLSTHCVSEITPNFQASAEAGVCARPRTRAVAHTDEVIGIPENFILYAFFLSLLIFVRQ